MGEINVTIPLDKFKILEEQANNNFYENKRDQKLEEAEIALDNKEHFENIIASQQGTISKWRSFNIILYMIFIIFGIFIGSLINIK